MNPINHPEIIHDVVVTDNYVAFVGVVSGSSDSITLHICNKGYNVLNPNSPYLNYFNTSYRYSLGTNSGSPFYHACALDGDMIAIATQDEMSMTSNDITVRTFDLATHTMTNAQNLQCYSHPNLKDVVYIPNKNRVVLLYNGYFRQTGNYCDIFCTVDPYNVSSNYVLPGITDNVFHSKFSSLDAMQGFYFVTTGGKYGFTADASSFSSGIMCYNIEDYNIVSTRIISDVICTFSYDCHHPIAVKWQSDTVPVQTAIPIQCIKNH